MIKKAAFSLAASTAVLVTLAATSTPLSGQGGGGTIVGHVKYMGATPVNPVVRLGADPRCVKMYAGKRLTAPSVVVDAGGGLQSAFVTVQGSFPGTPVPTTPAVMTQKDCVFAPHMIGARVGQTLQVKNDDMTGHNVHSLTMAGNDFNTSQPMAGMVFDYKLKAGEMLHIKCDIHAWMSGYVGIVDNPYYAVSAADGSFTITNVPTGMQTLNVWHEVFGMQTQTIDVQAGKTATVDFTYAPGQKAAIPAPVRELTVTAAAGPITNVLFR